MSEQTTGIEYVLKENRTINQKLEAWHTEARRTQKPVCITCAKQDYLKMKEEEKKNKKGGIPTAIKAQLHDKEHYMKGFKKISETHRKINETGARNELRKEWVLIVWKCPYDHTLNYDYPIQEYEELFLKNKK